MNVQELIKELQKLGYKVSSRKRTDGGYLITKIENMTFTGSKGNAYAREILGITMSEAKMKQLSVNVEKYIKGKKEKTLEYNIKKDLRTTQKLMRKFKAPFRISAKKVKWHLRNYGEAEARSYLSKMRLYAQGVAYEENVMYLANYVEDVAMGTNNQTLHTALMTLADTIRSKINMFKEKWINPIYRKMYEIVNDHKYEENNSMACVNDCYRIMES